MRVPPEFVVQDPAHANPPSLFLPVLAMVRQLGSEDSHGVGVAEAAELRQFLATAWPRLEAWFRWFNTTQAGELPTSYRCACLEARALNAGVKKWWVDDSCLLSHVTCLVAALLVARWRGRNDSTPLELNSNTLTSGLDDYPRASHPTSAERHLDLRCWMVSKAKTKMRAGQPLCILSLKCATLMCWQALASQAMANIGSVLGLPIERTAPYQSTLLALSGACFFVPLCRFIHLRCPLLTIPAHCILATDMQLLDQLHWDSARGQHLDWGMHTEDVRLERQSYSAEGKRQVGAGIEARERGKWSCWADV